MIDKRPHLINAGGKLIDLELPRVMGIINITTDSFYRGSRFDTEKKILEAAGRMLEEGADMLDLGGYSSRPGAADVPVEFEKTKIVEAVKIIKSHFHGAVLSIDTFRAEVAEAAADNGADIINDISGGDADPAMFSLLKKLNIPYVLMHMKGNPSTMQDNPMYDDVVADILKWFGNKIFILRSEGVKDIILDPGFGFGKTAGHNYEILSRLNEFSVAGLPILAGLSRKSMIWRTLGIHPEEALNGTSALNMAALLNGASILRVHDVKEAVEVIKLFKEIRKYPGRL